MVRKKKRKGFTVLLLSLIGALMLSILLAVSYGPVNIEIGDTYHIIFHKLFGYGDMEQISKSTLAIVWNMRVPRVLMGIIVGIGLALCGSVMQTTVNNPISEPYILGISAGATFGATLAIILGCVKIVGAGAFVGAIVAMIAVIVISSAQGKSTVTSLILAGTVVNALFSAFSNFIISIGADSDSMMTIKFWTMGSLASATWDDIVIPYIIVGITFLFFLSQYRIFNAMMMGDETSITLGIPLYLYRYLFLGMVAVITGVLVAACGIIGFVGLITPHIARSLVGTNHLRLIPIASLLGALFIIWADVLARILIENAELPIGIFTALVGAPFFIFIVVKNQKR